MEFWSENQGQAHLYSRYGTLPGRSCAQNHPDRHQAALYPLYYGEKQDHGRESSYWTAQSRPGGTPQEYTNWTEPELTPSSSSHFPFILNRHPAHLRNQGEYQRHEAREREWTLPHRTSREYERGFLREGWQRRWEADSPVHYNREVSAKRSDSSYRELEAWAARYSHSLPRRRRPEAELQGTFQGLVESSRAPQRDCKSGTDPHVATLPPLQQNPNSRVSGLWDRGDRQQAPTYYTSQAPAHGKSLTLNIMGNTRDQRRMFSQPPGYIAPPPYNSPHKSSAVMHRYDSVWEQGGNRQADRPLTNLREQEVSGEMQGESQGEKEDFRKPAERATCTAGPIRTRSTKIQSESTLAVQHPLEVQNSKTNQDTASKVIEGREFRLNKKTGGMTIFCLVSRIAGASETPSLPLCTPQMNTQSTEKGEVSTVLESTSEVKQMDKQADEVDFKAPSLTEQFNSSDVTKQTAEHTLSCTEMEMPEDDVPNKSEADSVSTGKAETEVDVFGRQTDQLVPPVPVRYPLWREPTYTCRAENESRLTKNRVEQDADGVPSHDATDLSGHPTDIETQRAATEGDTQEGKGLLIIDTTCVVVKMELIPSPKREHVHYLGYSENIEPIPSDDQATVSSEINCQPNQEATTDQSKEATLLQTKEGITTDLDFMLLEHEKQNADSESDRPSIQPSPLSEMETLEERAERILGISLHDDITELKSKDTESFLQSGVDEQDEKAEQPPMDKTEEVTPKEGESKKPLEIVETEEAAHLNDSDDITNLVTNEHTEDMSEEYETNSHLEMTEVPQLEHLKSEQGQDDIQPIFFTPSKTPDLTNVPSLSLNDLTPPFNSLDLSPQESPNPELVEMSFPASLPAYSDTLLLSHQLPSPSGSTDVSSSPRPDTDHLPSPPPPLDLVFQTTDVLSGTEGQTENNEMIHLPKNEVNIESLATDTREELISLPQGECHQETDATFVTDERQTNESDKEPGILEKILETTRDKPGDVNHLTQPAESTQTESITHLKESNSTEEQTPEETKEDPTEPKIQAARTNRESGENVSESQTEVNLFPQQFDFGQQADASPVRESDVNEDQLKVKPTQLAESLWEDTVGKNTSTDSQSKEEIEILLDHTANLESCNSSLDSTVLDSEVSHLNELSNTQLPSPPHLESDPLLSMNPDCPLPLNPDQAAAGIKETSPHPLQLDSGEKSPISFSSPCDSSLVLPQIFTIPQEENLSPGSPQSIPQEKELQYQKSLLDVVNRIRKHTAPDSENEDEEVCELSDPESVGESLTCQDVGLDVKSEEIIPDEAAEQELSGDGAETGHVQQVDKEPVGHADEDTLSCCSSSSENTVIVANEDRAEEISLDVKTKGDEESAAVDGEVQDEAPAEGSREEEEDKADTRKLDQNEENLNGSNM
ncbi:uncharacterized protein ACNS7B_005591 [Menidia menidia]